MRARCAPDARQMRARCAPDARQVRARCAPDARQVRARILHNVFIFMYFIPMSIDRVHRGPRDEEILSMLADVGAPASLTALLRPLRRRLSRRTLQRRIEAMVDDGRVVREGVGRAVRYRVAPVDDTVNVVQDDDRARASGAPLTLSDDGAALRALVRRPLSARTPTSYDVALLDGYRPNATFLLPSTLRADLRALGTPSGSAPSPAGTYATEILERLLIDLSWASSRLEGNTYSRLDTERLMQFGTHADGKDATETQMILNHKRAIEWLVGEGRYVVDRHTICGLHALLSDGLLSDSANSGRVRARAVQISGSVYVPLALPAQLDELLGHVVDLASEIDDPFEQSFFLLTHLSYLQPFLDVNKRTARLAANIPLLRSNLAPLTFVDVPRDLYIEGTLSVYEHGRVELLRDVYVWAYARSCQLYVATTNAIVPPDTFRLRHRVHLGEAVAAIVNGDRAPRADVVDELTPVAIAPEDRARFTTLVLSELAALHEGNAVRFGLSPLVVTTWLRAHVSKS